MECVVIVPTEFMELTVYGQEELHRTRWDPAALHQSRRDPHTPFQEEQLIAWGAVLHKRQPGKAMPVPLQPGRMELMDSLMEPGKEFLACRELEQDRRRPGSMRMLTTELLPEAKAATVDPRALPGAEQRRRQRRHR